MSTTLEILDVESLAKRIGETLVGMTQASQKFEPLEKLKVTFRSGDRAERNGWCERGSFMRSSFELARLKHASGASATEVRKILHEGIAIYAPIVEFFDYSPFEIRFAVPKSQAKKFDGREMPHDLGQVFLAPSPSLGPNYTTVQVKVKRQPAQIPMKEAFLSALIAWDFGTAKSMAANYRMNPAVKGEHANHFGLLREAILDNKDGALAFLENIPDGYSSDFPPERRELAEGVVRRDSELVKKGLRAVTTRFKTAWRLKTYCTPAKLKWAGSFEKLLPDIRNHLIWHKWLMADWAIAWMSLAWHRGMKEAFSDPDLFCEWSPWELCCPESNPVKSKTSQIKPKKKPGKFELREKLFEAAAKGEVAVIEELIKQGVKLDTYNLDRKTALMLAVQANHIPAVVVLIKAGADLTILDAKGRTVLGIAAEEGRQELVSLLLSSGIKPDPNDKPVKPLVRASRYGHVAIMKLLLQAGADPNRMSDYGNSSSLVDAARKNHFEAVRLLIEAGADVNQLLINEIPQQGALIAAANCGAFETLGLLLQSGADVNACGKHGWTALHAAACKGSDKILQELILAGAKLDAQQRDGTTALMEAVSYPECLRLLLKAGANPTLQNAKGKTVFDMAQDKPDSLKILKQFTDRQ